MFGEHTNVTSNSPYCFAPSQCLVPHPIGNISSVAFQDSDLSHCDAQSKGRRMTPIVEHPAPSYAVVRPRPTSQSAQRGVRAVVEHAMLAGKASRASRSIALRTRPHVCADA
jgi:hypothetical protein